MVASQAEVDALYARAEKADAEARALREALDKIDQLARAHAYRASPNPAADIRDRGEALIQAGSIARAALAGSGKEECQVKNQESVRTLPNAIGDLDTDGYHEYAKAIRQAVAQFSADRAFYSAYVNDQQEILRGLEARLAEATQAGILEKSKSEGLEIEIAAIRTHLLARAEKAEAQLTAERERVKSLSELVEINYSGRIKAEAAVKALRDALHLQAVNISFLKKAIQAGDPKSKLILRCDDIASVALDGSAKEEER
jgi:hypothetical protein